MTAGTLVMPKLGLTMTEGRLAEWKVAPGAGFAAGDILYIVETEKIANEIEAEAPGRLAEILVPEGETVPVGTPLARLAADAGDEPAAAPAPEARAVSPRVVATPLARRLARERGLDLAGLAGSGPRGRIKAADVERAAALPPRTPPSAPETARPPAAAAEKASPVQAAVARRLEQAKREIPHFYLTRSVACDRLLALKADVDALRSWRRTTLTHWIVAAVGRALEADPSAARVWQDGGLLAVPGSDVGVAVDVERGLFAPVVRAAGRKSVGEVALALADLAERAAAGRLAGDDQAGGVIAVSNLGALGVDSLTPIINPGQAMILGVGRVAGCFRPDAEGRPLLRQETVLTLAADHRVINGTAAARFLGRIAGLLEEPLRLLTPPAA